MYNFGHMVCVSGTEQTDGQLTGLIISDPNAVEPFWLTGDALASFIFGHGVRSVRRDYTVYIVRENPTILFWIEDTRQHPDYQSM